MTTWRELITNELINRKEEWNDIISCTLSELQLDIEFDSGFGSAEGCPFTAWTTNRVYFPAVYGGSEWVASVPRNPSNEPTNHVGGQ